MSDIMMMYKLAGWWEGVRRGFGELGKYIKYVGKKPSDIVEAVSKEMKGATQANIEREIFRRNMELANYQSPSYGKALRKFWQRAPEEFRQFAIGTGAALGGGTLAYGLGRHQGARVEREKPWYRRILG